MKRIFVGNTKRRAGPLGRGLDDTTLPLQVLHHQSLLFDLLKIIRVELGYHSVLILQLEQLLEGLLLLGNALKLRVSKTRNNDHLERKQEEKASELIPPRLRFNRIL